LIARVIKLITATDAAADSKKARQNPSAVRFLRAATRILAGADWLVRGRHRLCFV